MTRPGYITREQLYGLEAGKGKTPRVEKKPTHDYKGDFLNDLHLAGLPAPVKEFRFHKKRKWPWDFCYPDQMIAIEYQGGTYMQGKSGHSNVDGLERDYEKFTEGSLLGWTIILINAKTVKNGKALEWVERALKGK